MLVPCGDNVLLRREFLATPIALLTPIPADIAFVVDGAPDLKGHRVVVRRGSVGLTVGGLQLHPAADILALID